MQEKESEKIEATNHNAGRLERKNVGFPIYSKY